MWNSVDQIYIVTYQGSPKRAQCEKQVKLLKIPPGKCTWTNRPKMEIPTCVLSSQIKNHIWAYQHAKDNNYNNIIVLEDDFLIYDPETSVPEMDYKTEYFLKKYPKYDIFYYGYFPLKIDSKYNDSGIIKMEGLLLHAYLIHSNFYSIFLNLDIEVCVNIFFYPEPHDVWVYGLQANKRHSSYAVFPQLVYQDNMPVAQLFPKGNKNKKIFKFLCDLVSELKYNSDVYSKIITIILLLLCLAKFMYSY